ncbi:unnamed protein product [Rhizoctonia solani]|uniref:Ubiquitin-like domain-containing protein n=1 Tax=Rhizoctonia solani TaxID=456999 RepID=A0A8H3BUC2_9AGAM|nr:unnamed protein product [Rhizoctonia solani]
MTASNQPESNKKSRSWEHHIGTDDVHCPGLRRYLLNKQRIIMLIKFNKHPGGDSFDLEVPPTETIDDIKQRLADIGHPRVNLVFAGRKLKNETLEANDVKEGAVIDLKPVVRITIISGTDGSRHQVHSEPTMQIDDFKKELFDDGVITRVNYGKAGPRLIYNSKQLSHGSLEDYGIKDDVDDAEIWAVPASCIFNGGPGGDGTLEGEGKS